MSESNTPSFVSTVEQIALLEREKHPYILPPEYEIGVGSLVFVSYITGSPRPAWRVRTMIPDTEEAVVTIAYPNGLTATGRLNHYKGEVVRKVAISCLERIDRPVIPGDIVQIGASGRRFNVLHIVDHYNGPKAYLKNIDDSTAQVVIMPTHVLFRVELKDVVL